jgi:hypothetical protein
MKNTWKTISEITNKSNRRGLSVEKLIVNGKSVTSIKDIANHFNNFFVNVGENLASLIEEKNRKPYTTYLTRSINSVFTFQTVTVDDVCKSIKTLSTKDSVGYDGISTKLLKTIAPILIDCLTLIINQSLITGIFPRGLKIARIVPLHKKDDTTSLNNYRPVSLLTSISKIFEKIVHTQLYEYFVKNKLFHTGQYGFRKEHSTELAAGELLDRLNNDLDNKMIPIVTYLDLSLLIIRFL